MFPKDKVPVSDKKGNVIFEIFKKNVFQPQLLNDLRVCVKSTVQCVVQRQKIVPGIYIRIK